MSDIVKLRTRAEIDEQAAIWAWRLDAGPLAGSVAPDASGGR